MVTHGWQPDADHKDDDFDFDDVPIPTSQENIFDAIVSRLLHETDEQTDRTFKANILLPEWEGAYTGGAGDLELRISGSREARRNADTAGERLGDEIAELFSTEPGIAGYSGNVHFVGHSYGTIVNAKAADTLNLMPGQIVQFTTLDAPTDAPVGFSPNFNANWFQTVLPGEIDYFDNYYADISVLELVNAFGEPLPGAHLNQAVDYGHSAVAQEFYPDLVRNGPDAVTNPGFGRDTGKYAHEFDDWITPLLETFENRLLPEDPPATPVHVPQSLDPAYGAIEGMPLFVTTFPDSTPVRSGLLHREQSPVVDMTPVLGTQKISIFPVFHNVELCC